MPNGHVAHTFRMWALLFLILNIRITQSTLTSSSTQSCQDQCVDRNIAFPLNAYELTWSNTTLNDCDFQCHIAACQQGCTDLDGETSECQSKCSSVGSISSCQQGCRAISDNFLNQIQLLINQVTVDADLDPTQGIQLNWTFDHLHDQTLKEISAANLKWFTQSRSTPTGWKWTSMAQAFRDSKLFSPVSIPVTDMLSDVWFRLAVVWRDTVISSQSFHQNFPSLPAKPKPPILSGALQITNNSYAVCWHSERQGETKPKFKLVLKSKVEDETLRALETSTTCHLFRNLPTENCCTVLIEDVSESGGQPSLRVSIDLKPSSGHKHEEKPFIIFTNGTALMRMDNLNDYAMLVEPIVVPFMLGDDKNITALAPLSSTELLVGLSSGSIQLLNLSGENGTTIQRELRPSDGTPIAQIEVDHVQESLYFVRDTKGISRCWLKDCRNETKLETGSLQFIQSIAVDSWNGNIYYSTNNGDTSSTPLFPTTATDVYTLSITRRLAELPPVQTLQIDSNDQRLIAILKNGTIVSVDLVDRSLRDEREGIELSDNGYTDVRRSTLYENRLFWISTACGSDTDEHKEEGCLRSEELDEETQKIHLNTYVGGFGASVRDFSIMHDFVKPAGISAVEQLSLILTHVKGQVSWKAPNFMPFQASSNWRLLIYECRVEEVSADGTKEVLWARNLNSTELVFPAEASHSYKACVRVCIRDEICSDWSNVTNSALSGDQLNRLVVYLKSADGLTMSKVNLLGEEFLDENAPNINQYLSQYLLDTNQKLMENQVIIDYDSQSQALYMASSRNGSIYRVSASSSYTKLLDFLSIKHATLISKSSMLFIASSYQIAAYRLTSSFHKILYNCVEENCASVIGLASDDSTLYYMLKNSNGTVELFSLKIGSDDNQPQLLSIADKFPEIKQMVSIGGRLVLITQDGHVGTCDQRLSNLNLNNAIKDAQFLIQLADSTTNEPSQNATQFKFESGIEFQSVDKAQLSWSTTPELPIGQALYKIQLFQDGASEGDRTVDLTLNQNYTLPSLVLKKWCSKQKFDVQIDVITPWTVTSAKKSALVAPTKPPSPPTNLKIYATQQKTVDGTRAMIELFWDAPTEWNGDMLGFLVQCNATGGEDAKTQMIANANLTARHSRAFFFSATSGRVSCIVAARNEQQLVGAFSEPASIDSSEFRPLVRLFAIDSTNSLLAIYNWSTVTPSPPVDSTKLQRFKKQTDSVQYQNVAFISNELYAVRKEADSTQPLLVLLDINDVSNVLHKVVINGDLQQINAMTSDWVANRLLFVGNQDLMQISLENLQSQSVVTPKSLLNLSVGAQDAKQLTFDPFTNTAYLLSKNGSLFSLNLNKKQEDNLGLRLDCLKSQTVTAIVEEFVWNKPASPTLFALTWNGMITIDPLTMKCSGVNIDWAQFGEEDTSSQMMKPTPEAQGLKSVTSFSLVDKFFIFATATKLYVHDKITGPVTQIPILNPPLKQIIAASHSAQPYPDRQCFSLPTPANINFTVNNEDRTGAVIEVMNEASIMPATTCSNISFPQTQYQIYFKKRDSEKIKNIQSVQRITHVENGILDKETDYDVSLSWFNRYYMPSGVSEIKHLRTGYGYPTAPQDPQAFALTPDTVLLYWKLPQTLNAPPSEIKYKIKQSNENQLQPVPIGAKQFLNGNFSQDFSDIVGCLQDPCQAKIPNLRPSTDYQFWVSALHIRRVNPQLLEDSSAISTETRVRTKDVPGTLRFENATSDSLMLKFASLDPETSPREVYVQYRETILNHQAAIEAAWSPASNSTFDPLARPMSNLSIDGLRSATSYDFQFVAYYSGSYEYNKKELTFSEYFYQQAQQARTKAGAPTSPQDVSLDQDSESWYLKWKKPADNGGLPLTNYAIDFRKNSTSDWTIAERGLPADQSLRWRIDKKLIGDLKQVEFRVKAYNAEGFGDYAYIEPEHEKSDDSTNDELILWPLVGVILFCLALICGCFRILFVARNRRHKEKMRKMEIHKQINLEQIGQIQFYETPAELSLEIQNEIRNLPKIPRNNINCEQELGRGSFGVVSKGSVHGWEPLGQKSVTVAIKQMKGTCKGTGRSHFLKEAILMNNFDHPNIIRLLGVCLDNPNDHMLIMEYMEGGDLHVFLRACRTRSNRSAPSIRMGDLISMMVDVGRGCAYLEANKHVHRDLAARNCLISSRMSANRVTKISDFGMAREVYSSDYYRLNGEDLLPLRWLSPEAAHDGIFTSKSDVWAFGVLIFEILTLGEKPWQDLGNSSVLAKLQDGLNPGSPAACPVEINAIIQRTWIRETKERPGFNEILPELEKLRGNPGLQAIDPLTKIQHDLLSYENNGFDNSAGSNSSRSEAIHFNKSDTRNRGLTMPQSMRRRQSSNNQMFDNDSFRADSVASAETFMTNATGDYETPRSTPTGTASYSQRYSESSTVPYGLGPTHTPRFFGGYNNDAYMHDQLDNSGNENNAYEMLNQSAPPFIRHRPPPLANIPSAPNLQPPLGTPTSIQSYPSDSPTRLTQKRVSRV